MNNSEGYAKIVARNSSKCFDVEHASPRARAPVIQFDCHGGYNQQFSID